jgi:O-antigen/teichoic acid export membrane protein
MNKFFIKKSNKSFVRNVIIMATGTAAAQVIAMAASPFITRLYGPEAFGLLGVFTAIVGIVAPIAALTYPIAIVLPKDDKDARGIVRLSLYISVFIAMIVAIIILLFKQQIVNLFNINTIAPFLYLIPIVILFSGFQQVVEQWCIRKKQFNITAKVTFIQALVIQGGKVGIGFISPVASVLVVLTVFGQLLKPLMMIGLSKFKGIIRVVLVNKKESSLKVLAKQYRDFLFFRAPQTFIDSVTQSLPPLLLSIFFGAASVGFYAIGKTVLSIPTSLIGKSVGDVFYPRVTEAGNNGENLTKLLKKATLALGLVGIIPYGLVVIFGPLIFSFVFGTEWVHAGEYARWIALWSFTSFVLNPTLRALPVLSAQALHLRFTLISLGVRMVALFIGYYIFSSDIVAVALFCVSSAVLNSLLMLVTFKISRIYDEDRFIKK